MMRTAFKAPPRRRANRANGFSAAELVVVSVIIMLLLAMTVPSLAPVLRSYHAMGDARSIAGQIALARMRAAADFTQARLFVNVTANTYRIDVWNPTGAGCWQTDSTAAACNATTNAATTIPQDIQLGQGDTVGFGAAAAAPPGTQAAFGQAPNCLNNAGTAIVNTACVVFNSRGIPVTPGNPLLGVGNTATGNDAIYFTNNGGQTYAVTVTASGKTSVWSFNNGNWTQR